MPYNSETYRGVTPYQMLLGPEATSQNAPVPASSATAARFVDVIRSLRPDDAERFGSFGEVFQHEGWPIAVTFHPGNEHYGPAANRQFGLAAAHDIAHRRKLLWKRGRNPGIYTVEKTVFVEPGANNDRANLQAKVQETITPFAAYGEPGKTIHTRPAGEDEVVQAIDTIVQVFDEAFGIASGTTTERPPLDSGDNPLQLY